MISAGLVLIFIGFIFIISYPINKRKNSRCSAQTQGVLVEIRRRYSRKGARKSMHVYSYQVDGIDYQLDSLEHSPEVSKPGDACTIWYNPAKPKDAIAYRPSDKYLKILLLIGLALVLVGIFMTCYLFVALFIL